MKSSTSFSIVARKLFPSLKWFLTHHMQLFRIANVLRKVISHSVTWRQAQGCKILDLGYFKFYFDSKGDKIIGEKGQWSEFRPEWAFILPLFPRWKFEILATWKLLWDLDCWTKWGGIFPYKTCNGKLPPWSQDCLRAAGTNFVAGVWQFYQEI